MGGKKINVRIHRWPEQKKIVFAAIICWFIMALNHHLFKPYFRPPLINSGEANKIPIAFNYSNARTDVYEINGDIRIHGSSAAIFVASSIIRGGDELIWLDSLTIKPYPRKYDAAAMRTATGFKVKIAPAETIPSCNRNLDAPAVLFSTGGHAGNHFHSITDVLVPLFATSHHFNRNVILLATNHDPRLISKHKKALENLSKFQVYNIDKENQTLCFSKMIIGLKTDLVDLSIDPTQSSSFSTRNFTKSMRRAYSLERESVHDHDRPRMLVLSRTTSRKLTNQMEVVETARELGFEPVIHDLGLNMTSIAKLVNTFDVMVGVHGAALANMVFLPENAVVLQITPLGLDNFARMCFAAGPEEMKLKYLEYKVSINESSLLGRYPSDSEVYKDPVGFCNKKGFVGCKNVFMDNQDVSLDLGRFKETLFKALELLAS